jgi:hypothetical protein
MSTTLHSPDQWAQLEFGLASLGGRRRTQRLVTIAIHLAVSPGGTLPQAFPHWGRTQVLRVVGRYTARWWIEEYHKALKSGAGVEASQLERADGLESLIAILAVVAVRLQPGCWPAPSRGRLKLRRVSGQNCWRCWNRR